MLFEFPASLEQEDMLQWESNGYQTRQPAVSTPRTLHTMREFASVMKNKLHNEAMSKLNWECRPWSETAKVQIPSQRLLGESQDSHLLSVHLLFFNLLRQYW